jgi:hypothetical protein
VYERAVGDELKRMPPVLQLYFGPIADGCAGVGHGVYDEAGYCGPRWLRPVMRLIAGRGVMFPEDGTDVPFVITNTPRPDGSLRGERDFLFATARRRMVDAMTSARPGEIVDRLGRRGVLEIRLRAEADTTGMRLRSTGIAARLGALRLPLPPVARVMVTETSDPRGCRGATCRREGAGLARGGALPSPRLVHVPHPATRREDRLERRAPCLD